MDHLKRYNTCLIIIINTHGITCLLFIKQKDLIVDYRISKHLQKLKVVY